MCLYAFCSFSLILWLKVKSKAGAADWVSCRKPCLSRAHSHRAWVKTTGNELDAMCNLTQLRGLECTSRSWVDEFILRILLFFSLSAGRIGISSENTVYKPALFTWTVSGLWTSYRQGWVAFWACNLSVKILLIPSHHSFHEVVFLHWPIAPLLGFCTWHCYNLWLQNKCSVFFLCVDIDFFFFYLECKRNMCLLSEYL